MIVLNTFRFWLPVSSRAWMKNSYSCSLGLPIYPSPLSLREGGKGKGESGEGGKGKGGMGRNLAVEWRKAAIKQREYSFSIILQPLLTTVEQHLTIRKTQFKAVVQY